MLFGLGDDCTVLSPPTAPVLVTTDLLTEGVDFVLDECGPRAVGRRVSGRWLS